MNSLEKISLKGLIDSDISHDEFKLVINEEQNYFMLREIIRAKDNQLSNIERDRLTEHNKRIGIDETLRLNKIKSLKVKIEVQNLLKL